MSILLNGDCLKEMKELEDKSVDFIFCDLPYGQTSCKWDCCIDLNKFWIEIMRIKKLNTPIFMTTTTKFGVSLINSAPKKCPFRYDLVWVKSAPAGFLSAKKMPMRKHEMVYVFYEKLPFYDLSSHKHKFIKEETNNDKIEEKTQISKTPLPVSVVKEDCYEKNKTDDSLRDGYRNKKYEPPLPVSVIKEEVDKIDEKYKNKGGLYSKVSRNGLVKNEPHYEPPLPVSVVKEEKTQISKPQEKDLYGASNGGTIGNVHGTNYDPPLPTTMLEIKSTRGKHSTEKPVALMEWLLKYFSKEGDVVLDPTMGSGSTGVACKNMNRNFIGIEMDEKIYEVACERIWG
jgi:DNA modification methylase